MSVDAPAASNGTTTKSKGKGKGDEPAAPAAPIEITRIGTETLIVPIVGTTPLIVSRFSEKARHAMLAPQIGERPPKQKRDPNAEFEAAQYRLDDGGYGMPAVAFKKATVGAARYYGKSLTMRELRQMLFIKGERSKQDGQQLVRIESEPPTMREDVVRLAGQSRSADLRYRPEFTEWTATLEVIYVTSALSQGSVLSLITAGGFGVGVGEWRPEREGEFGTYEIVDESKVESIRG